MKVVWAFITQAVVITAWIFFRSSSVPQAIDILTSIITGPYEPVFSRRMLLSGFLVVAPVALIHLRSLGIERLRLPKTSPMEKGILAAVMAYFILTGHATTHEFIYFQF
jgi:hypothetical protein